MSLAADRIESLIFRADFETVRDAADSLPQAVAACVIRQAIVDALFQEESEYRKPATKSQHRAEQRRAVHRRARQDAVDFFAELIDPNSQDACFGSEEELLTLAKLCDLGGLDFQVIRQTAQKRISSRSPLHRRLLEASLLAAQSQTAKPTRPRAKP